MSDTRGRIYSVDEFTGQGLGVALTSGEIVVIVVEASVEATVRGRDAGDIVKCGIERCGCGKVCCPISARFNGGK